MTHHGGRVKRSPALGLSSSIQMEWAGEKQKCAKWSASQPAMEVYLPAFLPAVEGQAFALLANSINQLVMKRDIFVDGGSGFPTQVPGVSQGSSEETTEKPINALGFYQLQFPVS